MPTKRILLAETHPAFVGVVRLLLREMAAALLMVADEPSLTEAVSGTRLDLVLADLSFPVSSGENIARLLQRLNPELKAIMLSVHDDPSVVDECFAAGAKGFVLKRTASTNLLAAVEAVLRGGTYISPAIALKHKNENRNPIAPQQ
ncbi:MAG: response regulator transcription factor [Deltaproteobacteria bacterium]|nr:response regulator transcription factor [Deltaproteobacteria bacterium]